MSNKMCPKRIQSLEKYVPAMSQWDLCEYMKERQGIATGHFTLERIARLKYLMREENVDLLAHFWLLSNVN